MTRHLMLTKRDGIGARLLVPVDVAVFEEVKRNGCLVTVGGEVWHVLESFDAVLREIAAPAKRSEETQP